MNIVPAVRKALDMRAVALALAHEFRAQGSPLPLAAIELFHSLVRIETGGNATNNNVGNLAAAGFRNGVEVSYWTGNAWRPPWFPEPTDETPEKLRALHERMKGPKPDEPSAFRAYASEAEGIRDFVKLIVSKYPALMAAAKAGDVVAFRVALATKDPKTGYLYSNDYKPVHDASFRALRDGSRKAGFFNGLADADGVDLAVLVTLVGLGGVLLWVLR